MKKINIEFFEMNYSFLMFCNINLCYLLVRRVNYSLLLMFFNVNIFLGLTIFMAVTFVVSQFLGFGEIISQGYYFTGPESSVTTSYIYILAFLHLAHLFAGIIVLSVVTTRFNKQKYEKNKLGFEMALIFWHFLGALWIYLFFFIKYFS